MTTALQNPPTLPEGALDLIEAISLCEAEVNAEGLIPIVVMRPCVGRGRGRHLYTADMLRENAMNFAGWPMYIDHLSEEAQKALGGLPRSLRDAGGVLVESRWDPNIPAEGRFDKGGVVGMMRPVPLVRELVENVPEIVQASINAKATAVRPVNHKGQRVWLVEGIEKEGSVDLVTEAGAGGRVGSLIESVYHDPRDEEIALIESMTDEELVRHLRETRPTLVEALAGETEAPEVVETPETPAEPTPVVEVNTEPTPVVEANTTEEENVEPEINPVDALREALQTDEGRGVVSGLVEAQLAEERDIIRAEARADSDRQIELRDMRDEAHRLISEARLPDAFASDLRDRYEITDEGPTTPLNVFDEITDEGELERRSGEVLAEAVAADIARSRELVSAARPARVRGQGAAAPDVDPGESPEPGGGSRSSKQDSSLWQEHLQEAGFDDPNDIYQEA